MKDATTTIRPPIGQPRRRRSGTAAAAALTAAVALFVLLVGAAPASAHTGDQSYLYLDVGDDSIGGRIEVPLADLNDVVGVGAGGEDDAVLAQLLTEQDAVVAYLDEHLDIGAEGVTWPLTFEPAELFYSDLPEADDNYVTYHFTAEVGGASVPRTLDITFDPFVDEFEGRDSLLLIANDWAGGVIDNGHAVASAFDAGSRTQTIDLGDTGWWRNVAASAELGVNHIKTGPDHILFVLVLLLPSVLVFAGGWRPTRSFASSLWRVLKIVTMFTVAHSITFTLAGLDLVPLPSSKVVESIIAISIAAAALHNIRPVAPNKEWLIAFVFGLFHGMGFASLVEALDVPRSTQLLSLVGRNLGIEIGQAVVVVLLFPGLFLLRRTRWYRPFFVSASVLLAVISVGWMIERVAEVDLGVSGWIEPAVELPQAIIWVALFTMAAAALLRYEAATGRLVPVVERGEHAADGAVDSDTVPAGEPAGAR